MSDRRVIGILAHVDAGKTTLTERLLHVAGEVRHAGAVDRGNTITDWLEEEQARGITISTAAAGLRWRDVRVDVVDTPGHVDFSIEVERVLRVLDGAVLVVSATDGVQAQTQAVWQALQNEGIPTIVFVNKLDAPHRGLDHMLSHIAERLERPLVPWTWPSVEDTEDAFIWYGSWDLASLAWQGVDGGWPDGLDPGPDGPEPGAAVRAMREHGVEVLAEIDDAIMAPWLEGDAIDAVDMQHALRRAVGHQRAVPVLFGVALEGLGIEALLDAIVGLLPGPADSRVRPLLAPEATPDAIAAPEQPLTRVYVFKTETRADAIIAYVRVFEGDLHAGAVLWRAWEAAAFGKARLVTLLGRETIEVATLEAGAVGGLVFAIDAPIVPVSGDTLGTGPFAGVFERHGALAPVVWCLFEPAHAADHEALARILSTHVRDDPSLALETDPSTGQFHVGGRGELHLEVLHQRVSRALGADLPVRIGTPIVRPRLHLGGSIAATGVAEDATTQTTVRISLVITPEDGRDHVFELGPDCGVPSPIVIAAMKSTIDHVLDGLGDGAADHAPIRVQILRIDGGVALPISPVVYREATARALATACAQGVWQRRVPKVRYECTVPNDAVGRLHAEFLRRGVAIPAPVDSFATFQVLRGEAPLPPLLGFASAFRSITNGRGHWALQPAGDIAMTTAAPKDGTE